MSITGFNDWPHACFKAGCVAATFPMSAVELQERKGPSICSVGIRDIATLWIAKFKSGMTLSTGLVQLCPGGVLAATRKSKSRSMNKQISVHFTE
jgi:hypothetical protein